MYSDNFEKAKKYFENLRDEIISNLEELEKNKFEEKLIALK